MNGWLIMVDAVIIGTGVTLVMDVILQVLKRLLGFPQLDYALVGRWAGGRA